MSEHLLRQLSPLCIIESFVKAQQPPASLQTIPCQLQFVHRVDVLDMQLDARSVGRLRSPHVQVFVTPGLEVECVVAVVQVRKFWEQIQLRF